MQDDPHLLTVLRYAERNPVRAGLVKDAGRWPWGSFYVRQRRNHPLHCLLSPLPLDLPADWSRLVNQPQTAAEEYAVKLHIARNRPMGDPAWVERIAKALKLESTLRSLGRPAGTALTR